MESTTNQIPNWFIDAYGFYCIVDNTRLYPDTGAYVKRYSHYYLCIVYSKQSKH